VVRPCIALIISPLILMSLVSCAGRVDHTEASDASPVIRTDFSDEAAWKKIKQDIASAHGAGFSANVRFIDARQYAGLSPQQLLQRVPGLHEYGCIFVADSIAMTSSEHHLLVLDPIDPMGKTFRVIPSEAWAVESNLSLANMDYSEFADATDPDGVFRGFK
jgi:hypothetical protein